MQTNYVSKLTELFLIVHQDHAQIVEILISEVFFEYLKKYFPKNVNLKKEGNTFLSIPELSVRTNNRVFM